MLWSQVRVLSSILKLRHRIAAIAADCKSAVFRLRWFESNCLNKCSIRLTVRTQDFHSCNRGSIPRYCTKFLHGVYISVGRVPDCGSGGRRFESVCIPYKVASLAQLRPEHSICNPVVVGSNPTRGSKWRGGGIGRRATLRG